MPAADSRYRVNSRDIVSEEIEGEVIAIDLAGGAYYSLRGGAVEVWGLLAAGGAELEDVFAHFGDCGDRDALAGLFDRLREEGLIVPASDGDAASRAAGGGPVDYTEPVFEKYDDMQDYFLLDPIHDVGAGGWPRPAAESQR